MSRTVFILGAGASVMAGCPTMATFLDVADQLRSRLSTPYSNAFEAVFDARSQLQSVHSKARLDLHNIESVFSAFEMAGRFQSKFGNLTAAQIGELGSCMRLLIGHTLELSTRFRMDNVGNVIPPEPYADFIRQVSRIRQKKPVTIITFNYDIALDAALELVGIPVDYCLDQNLSGGASVPVIKLHGSINWGRCMACKSEIIPFRMRDFLKRFPNWPTDSSGQNASIIFLQMMSGMSAKNHEPCHSVLQNHSPVIVPPTWEKTNHSVGFENMWKHAARSLSEADDIAVIGYSLPPSDQFFPMLYALGTVSQTLLKRFWVFDPDKSVEDRFRKMLGEAASQRFTYFQKEFRESLGYLARLE